MIWTLPNILTVLRLRAAPALGVGFVFLPRPAADWAGLTSFVGASATDYIDGWMARAWEQQSKLGTMLDPIADKAMVVIALMVLAAYSDLALHLVLPAGLILFREVFVSGMREFLGEVAGTLKVTRLAKWKTASQMVAIAVLLAHGILQYSLGDAVFGMDQSVVDEILSGAVEDESGLNWRVVAVDWSSWGGIALLWLAAVLTCITGADYFLKARPHLRGCPMLDVLYFAWVRERIGLPKERVETGAATVAELVAELSAREERYAAAFADISALRVARDQELSDFDAPLAGVREVAFFPPMTGG